MTGGEWLPVRLVRHSWSKEHRQQKGRIEKGINAGGSTFMRLRSACQFVGAHVPNNPAGMVS